MTDTRARPQHHERVHDAKTLAALVPVFKRLNKHMLHLWRLGLGRWAEAWPSAMGRILVVEHRGRASGRRYLTPLNFTRDGGSIYCVAAFGAKADWFQNASAAGEVTVFMPRSTVLATVSDASASDRRLSLVRAVLRDAGFASYAAGIDPRRMSDADLAAATAGYQVVRFDPVAHVPDRLDDLRWVLPTVLIGSLAAAAWNRIRVGIFA